MKQTLITLACLIVLILGSTVAVFSQYGVYQPRKTTPPNTANTPTTYSYNTTRTGGSSAEQGYAVFYADYLHGQSTALGEIYNKYELTCAHKTLPLGTLIKVTRIDNGQSVTVRVNDRGPYDEGVVVDLSWAAANQIGLIRSGRTIVRIESVGYSASNPNNPNRPQGNQYRYGGTPPQSYSNAGITRKGVNATEIKTFPAGQSGYAIQLASYSEYSNAQRQILNMQAKGIEYLYIKSENSPSGTLLHKIVIAPFTDKLQAQQYLANVRMKYEMDGLVVKLK